MKARAGDGKRMKNSTGEKKEEQMEKEIRNGKRKGSRKAKEEAGRKVKGDGQ